MTLTSDSTLQTKEYRKAFFIISQATDEHASLTECYAIYCNVSQYETHYIKKKKKLTQTSYTPAWNRVNQTFNKAEL